MVVARERQRYGYYSTPDAVVRYTDLAPKGLAHQPVQ